MHLSEGILPAAQALAWGAASAPFVLHAARRARRDAELRGRLGLATALAFAVTLLPIPVPGLGATSHMCATPVLALVLGPSALALPMALVLLIQALLFAHGGLSTLGANVFTLGVAGPWVAWALARMLRRAGLGTGLAVGLACALGAASVYLVDALMLGLALRGAQPFRHWFGAALLGFAPIQGPLLLVEGLLSAWLVAAVERRRAARVPAWLRRAAPLLLLGALAAAPLRAEMQGLDEKVMEHAAVQAGRRPAPLVDLSEGEMGLFLFMGGGLVAGFLVGQSWERLRHPEGRDASGD